jgi:hypothetical protein
MNKTLLKGNAMTNDKQPDVREAFDKWFTERDVWPRLDFQEIFEAGWQAALQSPSALVQQSVIASYDHMKAAFAKWWKDSGGGPISMETNARHAWMNAWQAALSASPSVGLNTKKGQ